MPKTKKGQAVSCRRAQDDTPSREPTDRASAELTSMTPARVIRAFKRRKAAVEQAEWDLEELIIAASYQDEPKRSQLLRSLYWKTGVSSTLLMRYFEIDGKTQLHNAVGPMAFACPRCKAIFQKRCHHTSNLCKACHIRELAEIRAEEARKSAEQKKVRREEVQRMKDLPYTEYLKTAHWKVMSSWARQCAHYRCETCGSQKKLHVHHNTYDRLGEESLQDLTVLCEACHQKRHGKVNTESAAS
jgi:5-methylcytosine-specific restriction endonuclease McrA